MGMSVDKLQAMFDMQKKLQKRLFNLQLPGIYTERIPITVTSIVAELGEILEDEQGWKDWRKNPPVVDREHLLMEVVDLWHFVINLTLYLGFDALDVFKEFKKKNKENHARQDRKY